MDWKNLLVLSSFAVNFFLSLIIYFRSKKTTANIMFVITAFGITTWCLAMIFYRVSDSSNVLFWTKLLYFFPTFIPTAFLLFGLYFPNYKVKSSLLLSIICMNLVMAFLTLYSGAVIKNVEIIEGQEKVIKFGWAYYTFYNIYITGFFLVSYFIFFKKYLRENSFIRMQILYILSGMTLASIPAMITNLILPTLNYFEVNWVGQLFTVYWIGGVAYAIVKHRLMEIRLVAARTIAYALLIIILASSYAVGLFLAGNLLFNQFTTTTEQLVISTILALFMSFTFQPLKTVLEKFTDDIFYKGHYDPQELLKLLSYIMSTTLELQKLTFNILDKVLKEMRVTRGAFVLLEKKNNNIEYVEQRGYAEKSIFEKQDIEQFLPHQKLIIFDDTEEGALKGTMRNLRTSVILPLLVQNEKIGVLLLGEKASGDMYSQRDINVFEILGPQLSIAIQNAKEYEEIKRFNITLREEIDKATKELQVANETLQQLDKLKDEFVSLASHELRTPMTAIKSYLWMALAGKGGVLPEKLQFYLDRAYKSTDRLIKLVNDMLNVSRIESGRIVLAIKPVKLDSLINDTIIEILPRAQELGVNVLFKKPQPTLPDVAADADKIKEVIINLVGNSLKFTGKGGSVTVSLEQANGMALVKVKDTGNGISKEDMEKLFQKFSMVGSNYLQKQNTQGTGLGLYISKSLIELHGGKISVESEGEGKGTTFSFTLPLSQKVAV